MNKKIILLISALIFSLFISSCGQIVQTPNNNPVFTDPLVKIALVTSSDFVTTLINEAVAIDSKLQNNNTQVHMGYWSGTGNRDGLINVLNEINDASTAAAIQIPIWDEGVRLSNNFPAYTLMNNEYWYERSQAVEGRVTINNIVYVDPHPVTFSQADEIWGQYSTRYAEMARTFKAKTGLTPKIWCFVQGAKANRIFFTYEYPALVSLEKENAVQVYFAQSKTADWHNPADWKEGTENVPTPSASSSQKITDLELTGTNLPEIAYKIADAYRDGYYGTGPEAKKIAFAAMVKQVPGLPNTEYEAAFARALYLTAF